MKSNIFKKITASTYLLIFLFSFFIPFNQSFAQLYIGVSDSSDYTIETNYAVRINAKTIPNQQVHFYSWPKVQGFDGVAICTTDASGLCYVEFQSSTAGDYIINASMTNVVGTYQAPPKTITVQNTQKPTLTSTLATASLNSTSVTLKATGLTPNSAIIFNVGNGDSLTSSYYKQQNTTSDSNGNASSSFSGLSSGGNYVGIVTISNSSQRKINFTTPNSTDSNTNTTPIIVLPNGGSSTTAVNTDTTYTPLAPLPKGDGTGEMLTTIDTAGQCPFGNYLNIIIKLILGIAAVLAMVMIVMGGIEYMTSELISGKEAGKETITHAILGLLLALSAYLILNTINPQLLKACLVDQLPDATIVIDDSIPQTPINGKYSNGAILGTKLDDSIGKILSPCAKVGDTGCLPAYVRVANTECITIGQTNCTSTRGLVTNNLQTIQWGCKCTLAVTGGTEFWLHGGKTGKTSHHSNSSTVDLRITSELTNYITNGQSLVNWKRYEKDGISFLKEPNHWHAGP
ncbi:MAG: pilin [Candidatus Paceibacterota bacterium]